MERNIEKRAAFTFRMGIMYSAEQFVFVDECLTDRHIGRGYGYALQGCRAVQKSFFVQGIVPSGPVQSGFLAFFFK
jgi:hypothetical protein